MKTEKVKISDLIDNPKNTRIHPENQINEFVRSVEMFGVVRPIVVDENNTILIGHGLKKALEKMGRKEAEVLRLSGLSDKQKKKLLLSDNKIYQLGVDDFDVIDELIKEMQDFEIPGYSAENLEMLYGKASIAEDAAQFKQTEKEVQQRVEKQVQAEKHIEENGGIEAPKSVQVAREAQAEAKFVICPNCGEKVYVD